MIENQGSRAVMFLDEDAVPLGPNLKPIRLLHRHNDAYVTFAVKSDDRWLPKFSIRSSELENLFPEFKAQLLKDSFVGINASFAARGHDGRRVAVGRPLHRNSTLRYLCACYADIDCYRLNLDLGSAIGAMVNLQESGAIPPASAFVRSGRGIWLLWFLRDPERQDDTAQRAYSHRIDLYVRVQRAIFERVQHIGADAAALDAVRHIRVPGSFHTGSEQYVSWWIQGGDNGGFLYTLDELGAWFDVLTPKRPQLEPRREQDRNPDTKKQPNKRRGYVAMNAAFLADFQRLMDMRGGGFRKGQRNVAALIYAWILCKNGYNREDAHRCVANMGRQCRPRLTTAEIIGAIKSGFQPRMRRYKYQTISDKLDVTDEEAALLSSFPPAYRFRIVDAAAAPSEKNSITRAEVLESVQRRIDVMHRIIADHGGVPPSCRVMAAALAVAGFPVSYVQVSKDYKQLGIKTVATTRKEREQRSVQLGIRLESNHIQR